jgi:SAM-dependent methyltransferase
MTEQLTQEAPPPAPPSPFETEEFRQAASLPLMTVEPWGPVPAFNRPEYVRWATKHAIDIHLVMNHNARVKLVANYLPEARVIVDLGGAAGSIYAMGYPYKFDRLINVDLPPVDRHDMYRNLKMDDVQTPNGPISTLLTSMDDLHDIPSCSVDLVWSGQSMEHITEEQGRRVCGEVLRILKPGGQFCLDTPNGLMTEIHLAGSAPFIHPEHKIEYRPAHLQSLLRECGFTIVEALGVCEMIRTKRQGSIDYRDFYASAGVNTNVDGSYIQYYRCVPTRDVPAIVPPAPAAPVEAVQPPAPEVIAEPAQPTPPPPRSRWERVKDVFART